MKTSAIILAAGQGKRMNLNYNKMLYKIDNETVLEKCLRPFLENNYIEEIIVVVSKDDKLQIEELLNNDNIKIVVGGKERYDSVYRGLQAVTTDYVLIHDGARCFITKELISKIVKATFEYKATCLAVKSKDTVHLIDKDYYLTNTLNREQAYLAQTPQGFKTTIIKEAYTKFYQDTRIVKYVTDDAMLVNELTHYNVKIIESDYSNIKITTPEDIK